MLCEESVVIKVLLPYALAVEWALQWQLNYHRKNECVFLLFIGLDTHTHNVQVEVEEKKMLQFQN